MTEPRRVRTQAERDADGTTWRAAAQSRPGYATYPTTPPGNPSWWRGQPPAHAPAADGGPQPGEHDRCTKWCGFCHLGTSEPTSAQTEPIADAAAAVGRVLGEHLPAIGEALTDIASPRRRWWHRYTRRTV